MNNNAIIDAMQGLANLLLANVKAGGTYDETKLNDLIDTLNEVQDLNRYNQRKLKGTITKLNELKLELA